MQAYRLFFLAGILGLCLSLSACDASVPSQVHTGKMQVGDKMVTEVLPSGNPDPVRVGKIAKDILRKGRGDVTLTVPYLSGGEADAASRGAAYKKAFAAKGVRNVYVATVPVADRYYAKKIILDYLSVVAMPSKDCTMRIPGYQGSDNMEGIEGYQFGCEMQAITAKMVADPSDLLGKSGTPDGPSRRSGAITEPYNAGVPNQPMQGMQASTVGSGG